MLNGFPTDDARFVYGNCGRVKLNGLPNVSLFFRIRAVCPVYSVADGVNLNGRVVVEKGNGGVVGRDRLAAVYCILVSRCVFDCCPTCVTVRVNGDDGGVQGNGYSLNVNVDRINKYFSDKFSYVELVYSYVEFNGNNLTVD